MLHKLLFTLSISLLISGCGQVKNVGSGQMAAPQKKFFTESLPVAEPTKAPKAGYNSKGERWFKAIHIPGLDDE